MKSAEESMEILAAYDLTGSFRAAAELAGCSHHTVARLVAERDAGGVAPRVRRNQVPGTTTETASAAPVGTQDHRYR